MPATSVGAVVDVTTTARELVVVDGVEVVVIGTDVDVDVEVVVGADVEVGADVDVDVDVVVVVVAKGTTKLVSVPVGGGGADGASRGAVISRDAEIVIFNTGSGASYRVEA